MLQRQIYDAVLNYGISKKLIHSCRNSHSPYTEAMKKNREIDTEKVQHVEAEKGRADLKRKALNEEKRRIPENTCTKVLRIYEQLSDLK